MKTIFGAFFHCSQVSTCPWAQRLFWKGLPEECLWSEYCFYSSLVDIDFTERAGDLVLLSSLGFTLREVMSPWDASNGATSGHETKGHPY